MPARDNPFPHLAFQIVHADRARLPRVPHSNPVTEQYKRDRAQHAARLHAAAGNLSVRWREIEQQRLADGLPPLSAGHPLLLLVDDGLFDIEFLRSALGFEIVSEEEDGYIIVAADDVDFAKLRDVLEKFTANTRGGTCAATLHDLIESTDERLRRVLSPELLHEWPNLHDGDVLTVDLSISCIGKEHLPKFEPQSDDETDAVYERRKDAYMPRYRSVALRIENLKCEREVEIERIVGAQNGTVLSFTERMGKTFFDLPDCFTVRARVGGRCLRDMVLNYAHLFQVDLVDPVDSFGDVGASIGAGAALGLTPPSEDAPSVCVIDSGVQEDHLYLAPAIVGSESRCFLPGVMDTDTADYVQPHGHGTRVAGVVLFPREPPRVGQVDLPCWIHNARVLDAQNHLPDELMPALYVEQVVAHYSDPARLRPARIFNHSINSCVPFRRVHMSTWGASIDKVSYERDVLVIQSAGNIHYRDVATHLAAGRNYPEYQLEDASRVRNPGQSLCALTVGSVAHVDFQQAPRVSVAKSQYPSAFSPAGAGIWDSIKPDVVEYGGDYVLEPGAPVRVFPSGAVASEMVRSTMHSAGATSKDDVGTSFAAPKVSHIAAMLARELPDEPCLLYRALIANSARWPQWAEDVFDAEKLSVLRRIGYGIPDCERATVNSDHRVTLVSTGEQRMAAREAHIYRIPVPAELRRPEDSFLIRIDVTLAYAAMPRRTRRRVRGYLSTVLDWDVSKQGESVASFRARIFADGDQALRDGGDVFRWMLRDQPHHGVIRGISRQYSTLQKDWCFIRSHELPADFCIAVVGHPGWDPSPETRAKYALAVSFEAVNADLRIYTPIRVALDAVQVPVEVEQRIEVESVPATE